jgi:HSP20 family protein
MTKLIGWTPTGEWIDMQDEMNRLFDSLMPNGGSKEPRSWAPAADVRETEQEFFIRLDVPGVDGKSVKVSVFEDTLTVQGERREMTDGKKDDKWHRVERFHGAFERRFHLAGPMQADKVEATYKDGVLEVRIPKSEQARPREIPVQVSGS